MRAVRINFSPDCTGSRGECRLRLVLGKASGGHVPAKEISPRDSEDTMALSVPRPSLAFELSIPLAAPLCAL